MQRFLVGSRDTSHFKIIPVLGYSNKCVISAMTSRGEPWGEQGLARGVPPCCTQSSANREQCEAGWTRQQFVPTAISAATDWPSTQGGALCRPHRCDAIGETVNGSTVT